MIFRKDIFRFSTMRLCFLAFLILFPVISSVGESSELPCFDGKKTEIFIPAGHSGSVNAVEWSPDGRFILSGSSDGGIKLWDAQSGRLIRTFSESAGVLYVHFLPGGKSFFSVNEKGGVGIWDVARGGRVRDFALSREKEPAIIDPVSFDGSVVRGIVSSRLYAAQLSEGKVLPAEQLPESAPVKKYFSGYDFGHKNLVTTDGQRMLSAVPEDSSDTRFKKLILWEVSTGKILFSLDGHTDRIDAVALSMDESYAASGGRDKTVRVWDLKTGKAVAVLIGHQKEVEALAFSPDRKYVLSGSRDHTMRLWDIEAGKEVRVFAHSARVTLVRFSPDGRFAVSGDAEGAIRIWDAPTGEEVMALTSQANSGYVLVMSADGRLILSGTPDGKIRLWDKTSGKLLETIQAHTGRVAAVHFTPDGKHALSAGEDKTLKLWNPTSGALMKTFAGHREKISRAAISPDGQNILSLAGTGDVRLWNLISGAERKAFTFPGRVLSIGFADDSRHLLIAYEDKVLDHRMIKVLTLEGREVKKYMSAGFHFSEDGKYFLANEYWELTDRGTQTFGPSAGPKKQKLYLDSAKKSTLVDIAGGGILGRFGQSGAFLSLSACAEEGIILTKSRYDQNIVLWDARTGLEIRRFAVKHGLLTYDGRKIVAPSGNTLQAFDRASGMPLAPFTGRASMEISSLALSPDGSVAVTGDAAGEVQLWDIGAGTLKKSLPAARKEMILATAVSFDRLFAASLSRSGVIRIWNLNDGRKVSEVKTDYKPIYAEELAAGDFVDYGSGVLAFSPDGLRLACGAGVWEVATGKNLLTIAQPNVPYPWVTFSPDGRFLLSRNMLWDASSGRLERNLECVKHAAKSIYSADGRFILCADLEGGFYTVDAATGRLMRKFADFVTPGPFDVSRDKKMMVAVDKDQHELTVWDLTSGRKNASIGVEQEVFSVSLTFDRLRAILRHGISISEYDLRAGKEIVQLISFIDGGWMVMTPEGYYNTSSRGDRYINVRVGESVYGIENYRESFYRPEVVRMALAGESLKDLPKLTDVKEPPKVKIVDTPASVAVEEVQVRLSLDEQGGGIGDIRLYLNGTAVLMDTRSVSAPEKSQQAVFRAYPLKLVHGKNVIHAAVQNGDNSMRSNEAVWEVTADYKAVAGPSLAALAIGVGEVGDSGLKLPYAAASAELVAGALKGASEGIYEKPAVKTLTRSEETTAEAILREIRAFQALRAEDLFVIYISGYAVLEEGEYFLLTSNVNSLSAEKLKTDAISLRKLMEALGNIPAAGKLILIDACNPGVPGAEGKTPSRIQGMSEETALKIMGRALGSTILASSAPLSEAMTGDQGKSPFAYLVTEGLKGRADTEKTGLIKTTDLTRYVRSQMPALTGEAFSQSRYPIVSINGRAFPIGKVK
jgi:WD40 repeat protein